MLVVRRCSVLISQIRREIDSFEIELQYPATTIHKALALCRSVQGLRALVPS
jgi:hypothetical protein